MGQKKHDIIDPVSEPKKRRRVGFFDVMPSKPKTVLKCNLVSSKDEVGASDSLCIDPVDLNGFFDDGKLYGYQGLKIIYFEWGSAKRIYDGSVRKMMPYRIYDR